jgi:hypothetical protein
MDYLDAIRNILKGKPVENLEKLRTQYNDFFNNYYSLMPLDYKKEINNFPKSNLMVVSSFAHNENEILKGNDSAIDSYLELKKFGSNVNSIRKKGKKILMFWLEYYPFNSFLEKMKEKEKSQDSYFKNFSYN